MWLSSYHEEIKEVHTLKEGPSREEFPHGDRSEIEIQDLTLFIDATIFTPNQMVGLGAVIITPNKKIQAALSKPLEGILSVLHAEALALLVGLRWAHDVGLPIKTISTDSLSLVQALNNTNTYHNELGILNSDIKMLLPSFSGASISHISRNFNLMAHNLAKRATQLDDEHSWVEEISLAAENHI